MPVPYLVLKQAYLLKFLRSVHTYVRGFRSPFLQDADFLDDFSVNARNADIFKISFSMFFTVVLVDSIFISWVWFFSRPCILFRVYLLMLYIVFIVVMTINAFFNEQPTINVVALKQEVNTEY